MAMSTMADTDGPDIVWGCCTLGLQDDCYVVCIKCSKAFHEACLVITNNRGGASISDAANWTCLLCTKKQGNNDNTPVRFNPNVTTRPGKRQALNSPPNSDDKKPITREEMDDILKGFCHEMQKAMQSTMTNVLHSELKSIKEEITEVKESMTFVNLRFEEITKEHAESRATIKSLTEKNDSMQSKMDELYARVNQMEQNARSTNIEIQCVPEKRDENVLSIVSKLSNVIDYQMSEENISHCTRIAKINKDSIRPRSIVVQFSTPRIRDNFLAAAIKFNKSKPNDRLNTSHINIPGAKVPIYVTEHLSAHNKALHAAARLKAKDIGYKYVWVRGGRIYMRKSDNSEYKIIKDISDLNKLK